MDFEGAVTEEEVLYVQVASGEILNSHDPLAATVSTEREGSVERHPTETRKQEIPSPKRS